MFFYFLYSFLTFLTFGSTVSSCELQAAPAVHPCTAFAVHLGDFWFGQRSGETHFSEGLPNARAAGCNYRNHGWHEQPEHVHLCDLSEILFCYVAGWQRADMFLWFSQLDCWNRWFHCFDLCCQSYAGSWRWSSHCHAESQASWRYPCYACY